jgi:hypothetical protein
MFFRFLTSIGKAVGKAVLQLGAGAVSLFTAWRVGRRLSSRVTEPALLAAGDAIQSAAPTHQRTILKRTFEDVRAQTVIVTIFSLVIVQGVYSFLVWCAGAAQRLRLSPSSG